MIHNGARITCFILSTVGEDYQLFSRRAQLLPRRNTSTVYIEVFDDDLVEEDEEFVVKLELNEGSSAVVDISSAIVLIMGDQGKY